MGNGLTVWNLLDESNGDYKTIAHINTDRTVKIYEKDLPETIIEQITDIAETTEMSVSATQDTPVFDKPATQSDYHLPDPEISIADRNRFGYTIDDILPLTYERAVKLFNDDHTIYMLYPDNTEGMAFDIDEFATHDGIFGIEREEWESTRAFAEMMAANKNSKTSKESLLIYGGEDTFGIYQLKHGDELRDYRWESHNSLEQRGLSVERGNYELVYTAPLTAADTPDSLYEQFNAAHPPDFTGHSLSVSDVLVFQRGGEVTSRYVDDFGFTELPAFLGCEKQPEITTPIQPEIPSGPSVDELEAQVKSGQSISLLDLSNAVNRERKPKTSGKTSILSALEENKKVVAQGNGQNVPKRDNNLEVAT